MRAARNAVGTLYDLCRWRMTSAHIVKREAAPNCGIYEVATPTIERRDISKAAGWALPFASQPSGLHEEDRTASCRMDIPQQLQRGIARILSFGERREGRANDPDRRSVHIERAPRRHKAGPTLEIVTAIAARIADNK
jgi:hypothetical protein